MNNGLDTIRRAKAERYGFLRNADIRAIADDPSTRLRLVLIRCGGCRFLAPAQDVNHLIQIITASGAEYVRDVSLPVES